MYGVVCSILSCLFEYVAVYCVGRSVVVVCLCFNEFSDAGVEVGKILFGGVVCVGVVCVRPCS